jgi:NAD+ synthase
MVTYRVGVDIGGTFTDIVLLGSDGTIHTKKISSSVDNYASAIVQGLDELFAETGLADAEMVAETLGIGMRVIEITPQVDAYFADKPDASRSRRGNKMARERMTVLFDQSEAERALVVGTSNKTELLLGYGTIFGDMASAINPLGDLYKSQVWQLGAHVGVPDQVIRKPPSADLWVGQSDEDELGYAYAAVDRLLFHLVDRRVGTEELIEMGHDRTFVEAVLRRVRTNQYKRRPPIILKVSSRTIDREFRYPRDWGV